MFSHQHITKPLLWYSEAGQTSHIYKKKITIIYARIVM